MTEAANRIQELEAALDTTAKLLRDALDALQHCNEEKVELERQVAELSKQPYKETVNPYDLGAVYAATKKWR